MSFVVLMQIVLWCKQMGNSMVSSTECYQTRKWRFILHGNNGSHQSVFSVINWYIFKYSYYTKIIFSNKTTASVFLRVLYKLSDFKISSESLNPSARWSVQISHLLYTACWTRRCKSKKGKTSTQCIKPWVDKVKIYKTTVSLGGWAALNVTVYTFCK